MMLSLFFLLLNVLTERLIIPLVIIKLHQAEEVVDDEVEVEALLQRTTVQMETSAQATMTELVA
jgi:hypothetical protein